MGDVTDILERIARIMDEGLCKIIRSGFQEQNRLLAEQNELQSAANEIQKERLSLARKVAGYE